MILLICFREEVSSFISGTRINKAPETKINKNKLNFAKKHLGTKSKETKIVGLLWDKREDFFIIQVSHVNKNRTKRNILSTLASFYDPFGFVSPCLVLGKIIDRNLRDLKVSWDREIPIDIETQWLKWITGIKTEIKIPRSIPIKNEPTTEIDTHLFSDASIDGVCTVAYAVVHQPNKVSQRLITSKSRLAKKNIWIPRLELIAARMSSNLAGNLKCSLSKFNIDEVYAWSDSTVTLHGL